VDEGYVEDWDDPRMPTIAGLRRRGVTPEAIANFMDRIGISTANSVVDVGMFEHAIREDLNEHAPRVMAVLEPLKMVIDNYPEDKVEWLEMPNHPYNPEFGTREVPFCREVYIEREDFMEEPPPKYRRLAPGREVRLMSAYLVTYSDVVKDEDGNVVEVHCTYDPETRGGDAPDGRKVRGTLHWVSAPHAVDVEARLYDRLFDVEDPEDVDEEAGETFLDNVNPDSLVVLSGVKAEPGLTEKDVGFRCQFMRKGYYCVDPDTTDEHLVLNRTISLRDTWAKIRRKQKRRNKS
jgi:glutaminyl-tRNA synthetase